jgi:dihydrolipoamide dehydrogenase
VAGHDLIVIGAGPGGYVCAIRAAQHGLRVACVERDRKGGVCLNWGCIPTKALLQSADLMRTLRRAGEFGVRVGEPSADIETMVSRSRAVAGRLERGVGYLFNKNGVEALSGVARLDGPGRVVVRSSEGETVLEAPHVVLATGARPRALPGIVPDGEFLWTSREAMVPKTIPKHLLILGAGAIGCEFAYFYRSIGTEVTLVEAMDRVLPAEDAEVSTFVAAEFKKQGIAVHTGTRAQGVARAAEGIEAVLQSHEGELRVAADRALLALGVVGNLENIGLESVGLSAQGPYLKVDEHCHTGVEGLWAIGDLCGPPALAHRASAEGIYVADRVAGVDASPPDRATIPYCTYCQPEVAHVGWTEEQVRERGIDFKVGRFPFAANGKALGAGHPEGFVKVLIGSDYGEILGVHIVGHGATDLLAEAGLALRTEVTAAAFLQTIHPHPTLSEALFEAVADALDEAIHI